MTAAGPSAVPDAGKPMIAGGIAIFAVVAIADSLFAPLADGVDLSAQNLWWWASEIAFFHGCGLMCLAAVSRRRCFAGERNRSAAPPAGARWALAAGAVAASWDWGLYLMSSAVSATEVAAAVIGQWSILLVLLLAACDRLAPTSGRPRRLVKARVGWAMAAASAGMLAVTASQVPLSSPLLPSSVGFAEAGGVLLAFLGASTAAITTGGSIVYGEKAAAEHGQGNLAAMWHMLVAAGIGKLWGAVQLGCVGAATGGWAIPAPWVPGMMAATILVGSAMIRVGNAQPRVPVAANMICLAIPALSVLWLALDGIAIPRVGLYLAGAAAITCSLAVALAPERGQAAGAC